MTEWSMEIQSVCNKQRDKYLANKPDMHIYYLLVVWHILFVVRNFVLDIII